jgi:hypothetical protein
MFLIMGVTMIFFGCEETNSTAPELSQGDQTTTTLAKKPAAKLVGTMDLDFMFTNPIWVGTVDLEGYGVYGIRFNNLGGKDVGNTSHFIEYFEIYDLLPPNTVYLGASDFGVVSLANSKYRMNGEIEVATEPFEMWLGRHVHMSGVITWQTLETPDGPVTVPKTAPGILRIN